MPLYPGIVLDESEAVLGVTQFDITSTTYATTNLSITLPGPGKYIVWAEMRQAVQVSASPNGAINTEFYNMTDAAAVANSERLGQVATQNDIVSTNTVRMQATVRITASKTIALYAKRASGPTYTNCYLYSDSDGRTIMGYIKIA